LWAEIMRKPIVFGRGENPINFVSVDYVATAVEHAVLDGDQRGRVIEVGGPRNLTFNELAASLQRARGESGNVRHVPRPVLRVAARFSRQARAAIAMDTIDMTFPPKPKPGPLRRDVHHTPPNAASPNQTISRNATNHLLRIASARITAGRVDEPEQYRSDGRSG
jgi:nucleoside-diphosphate-sugar epimerase